jgi:hypothetical protein
VKGGVKLGLVKLRRPEKIVKGGALLLLAIHLSFRNPQRGTFLTNSPMAPGRVASSARQIKVG